MEIRALREGDDRSRFQSGAPELDRFFRQFAGQNATIAPGHIEIEDLPLSARKKLPRYPLPVVRLARLAVDESARGQGLGEQLLRFVLTLAIRMASDFGCVGVIVDAKAGAVGFYSRYGFVPVQALEGQSDARPQPETMFLSMRAIKDSTGV